MDLFIKYNTPLASSVAVERLFSQGSDILRPKRASMASSNFEKFLFMKGNMTLFRMEEEEEEEEENDFC